MTTRSRETLGYVVGLTSALALTALSFAAVQWRWLDTYALVSLVFGLGVIQMLVHFRFFLHIGLQRSSRDDLMLILFSVLIVTLMAGGTIVLMLNLRERMM